MSLKILIVDDATFIRDLVKKQMRDQLQGVEVFEAVDGVRALAVLKHNPVDLILSEWELPVMSGEELLRQVRSSPETEKIPFVMLSSRGDRDHIVKVMQAGVSDYLAKPFTTSELLNKIYKQLKSIGKMPSGHLAPGTSQTSSLDILTGGQKPPSPALAGGSASPSQPAPAKNVVKAKAQLRFAGNKVFACVVREISLQMMNCVMQRSHNLPALFDQVIIDIDMGERGIATVNGYVHSIAAGESKPDTNIIKIVVRFSDNDDDKFAILSKFIEQM